MGSLDSLKVEYAATDFLNRSPGEFFHGVSRETAMLTRFHKILTACGLMLTLVGSGCTSGARTQQTSSTQKQPLLGRTPFASATQESTATAAAARDAKPSRAVETAPTIEQTTFDTRQESADEVPATPSTPPSTPATSTVPEPTAESSAPIVNNGLDLAAETGYPLDLSTALLLTTGQNIQVAFAQARIAESQAQADRAESMWLPSLRAGVNYNKHEGRIQDVAGSIIDTSRGALYTGLGANAVGAASPGVPGIVANFHLTDAIFQPKAARNAAVAREWEARTATNNELHQTALVYLELLRAHQELVIAQDTHERVENLTRLTQAYAKTGQGLESDHDRARTELSLRVNEIQRADEQIRVVSARLSERLRLDPFIKLEPQESVLVQIEMVPMEASIHDLVAQGLGGRPEICESRSLVAEAVERLKREQYAPLIPSVLLGVSYGGFGGGLGSNISNFGNRLDGDAVAYWELRNFGAGDRAARGEANSRLEQARLKEIMALDRVAREVIEAHTQVESRRKQVATAEEGIKTAISSYHHNLERIENAQGLPIEVLQSIQALAAARREYLRAVIDYNVAQFTLHRAIGWPGADSAM